MFFRHSHDLQVVGKNHTKMKIGFSQTMKTVLRRRRIQEAHKKSPAEAGLNIAVKNRIKFLFVRLHDPDFLILTLIGISDMNDIDTGRLSFQVNRNDV